MSWITPGLLLGVAPGRTWTMTRITTRGSRKDMPSMEAASGQNWMVSCSDRFEWQLISDPHMNPQLQAHGMVSVFVRREVVGMETNSCRHHVE